MQSYCAVEVSPAARSPIRLVRGEFPELDDPVFLLGACALVDAFWAAVGDDSLGDVLGVLLPAASRR